MTDRNRGEPHELGMSGDKLSLPSSAPRRPHARCDPRLVFADVATVDLDEHRVLLPLRLDFGCRRRRSAQLREMLFEPAFGLGELLAEVLKLRLGLDGVRRTRHWRSSAGLRSQRSR